MAVQNYASNWNVCRVVGRHITLYNTECNHIAALVCRQTLLGDTVNSL